MGRARSCYASAAAAGVAVVLAGCTGASVGGSSSSTSAPSSSTAAGTLRTAATPSAPVVCRGKSVPQIVQEVQPSVVTVRTPKGLGSGIVYRRDMILTDQHVVARQEGSAPTYPSVEIALADGTTSRGTVVGSDLLTDLAIVRVTGKALPPLTFRTSLPSPGETVLAIGSPLGFSSSVTEGIVSGVGRNLPAAQSGPPLVDLIQTDAPISPGNSGGALIDTCGHVVGVNEAYIPPSSGAVSLGFATPSVVATDVADQLIASGKVEHPWLGISVTDLTPSIAQSLGTHAKSGVVIAQVSSGSPAERAGLKEGDVITAFAGQSVKTYADLLGFLRGTAPGQSIPVTVDRGGTQRTLHVTVGRRSS